MTDKPIEHGTHAGWNAHIRHNIPMCDACRRAATNYQYQWRNIEIRHAEQLLTGQTPE